MNRPLVLSKSDYMLYLKHPAWLWLKKNDPKKLPPVDASTQALFDSGNAFESLVEQQFVGLVKVGFDDYQSYLTMPKRTKELLDSGEKILSQGRFESNNLTCICDILELVGDNSIRFFEIKASTKVKPEHIEDLAFQTVVLENCGYTVSEISVIYCNNGFIRHGQIQPTEISTTEDVTEAVKARLDTTRKLTAKAIETAELTQIPDISPALARMGSFSEWLKIYKTLKPDISEFSIYNLVNPGAQLIAGLEHKGIADISEIPLKLNLSIKQKRQIEVTKLDETIIHQDKIDKFLHEFKFPLYFLDYETLAAAIPPFDGLRPYEQLPFQYSLHILPEPGGELKHREYLHENDVDPSQAVCEHLRTDIADDGGTVLVWYENFEKTCNRLLKRMQPDFGEFLDQLNGRVMDLMTPFDKGWYLDKNFFGSASIKKVLPALVPELNYAELEISEGASAQSRWMQTVLGGADENKSELFAHLRKYCQLDTLAMVEIYRVLLGERTQKDKSEFDLGKNEQLKLI